MANKLVIRIKGTSTFFDTTGFFGSLIIILYNLK
jgi:hypothetical protein